jgi:hypothetical protein
MTEDLRLKARKLAESLQEGGSAHHAATVKDVLSRHLVGDALLSALRAACDTLLTAAEAIDPVSEMELERVRRALDEFLTPDKPGDEQAH